MEIRLKTAEEFRDAHMTIEIRATPEEAWRLSDRLYTAEEVGDYQASEADRLRDKVRELAAELAAERKRRAEDLDVVERQRGRLIEDANRQEGLWAEERRTALQSIAARDRLLATATTRVRGAIEILGARRVAEAADDIVTTKGAILSDAIRNALAALSA